MAKGNTTYIVETNLDREEIDSIIEDWAASISLFKKEYKGHSYFQIKDWFGRIIGRKRKCFEYAVENNQIIFKDCTQEKVKQWQSLQLWYFVLIHFYVLLEYWLIAEFICLFKKNNRILGSCLYLFLFLN